jgi:ABC-2 type transport system permease protein
MKKIWTIAWKEVYLTFTDRNLLLIMVATPLLISSIVGLAFGGFAEEGGVPFSDIPVVIVNLDEGAVQEGMPVSYGQSFVDLMVPREANNGSLEGLPCPLTQGQESEGATGSTLQEMFDAQLTDSADDARNAVRDGDYAAAVIIPVEFSERITSIGSDADTTSIEVYGDSGQSVFAAVIHNVVTAFTDRVLTGNIARSATINGLLSVFAQNPQAGAELRSNEGIQAYFTCGFEDVFNSVNIESLPVDPDANALSGFGEILVMIGSAQAVFFAMFAGQFGVISIVEERRTWTLQRLIVSPTPKAVILAGKLFGTMVMVVFQLVILLACLTLITSLADGQFTMIWGTNYLAIAAVILALGVAVCGLGVLVSGIARTPEQVGSFGSVLNIIMAMFGGAFGVEFGPPLAYLSIVYWGVDAFNELSTGGTDIAVNLLVLLCVGAAMFVVGWWLFSRRVDV